MSAAGDGRCAGELALVLHTHMPYVEGFGTWPFGEEWLWEAMATCYLPLLDVLDRAPLTLSITPVLADQLEAAGTGERFLAFLREVRRGTHRADIEGCREGGRDDLVRALERSAEDYERAGRRFEELGGDLLGALGRHAAWTSAATHAVLPLVATDAGVRLQVGCGVDSHRRRFGDWAGGFWLPECGYAPWLDPLLAEAGVGAVCVDLSDRFGIGAVEHLRPYASDAGPVLVPIDRVTIELVWSDHGYPAHGAYRDYHHHTIHHHNAWANDGGAYDHDAALDRARADAADFVERTRARLDAAALEIDEPLAVCAIDTELLGHWWYEGVAWLDAVIDECARQGLAIAHLDDALARRQPAELPSGEPEVTTWGTPRDLSTWDGPPVADLAWRAREAELDVILAAAPGAGGVGARAVRELLALQSSDWAFMVSRGLAGPYPRERSDGHAAALAEALAARPGSVDSRLRDLAPDCPPASLPAP